MEDLTVALLGGVTPRIQDRGLTAALFGLLTVEARHAAWARNIVGATPAPRRSTSRGRSPRCDERRRPDALRGAAAARRPAPPRAAHDGLMAGRGGRGPGCAALARAAVAAAAVVLGAGAAAGRRRRRTRDRRAVRAARRRCAPAFVPGAPRAARVHAATCRAGRPCGAPCSRAAAPRRPRRRVAGLAHAHAGGHREPRRRDRAPARTARGACGCASACRCCPTGRRAGCRARALGGYGTVDTRLDVDLRRLRATLYRAGRPVFRADVGVGTAAVADAARDVLRPQQAHPLPQPGLRPGRVRHERALADARRTGRPAASSGSTARTGPTCCPGGSRTAASGCATRDILALARLMPVGTPLVVH